MNRTDRLMAILLELQAKGQLRAEDLAATFEVSKRTIYRDMLALMETGIPVISTPSQGFQLMEGFFLPPVNFTLNEAMMLILGAEFIAQKFDMDYRVAAQTASSKIEAVLPEAIHEEMQALHDSIWLLELRPVHEDKLVKLRGAIISHQTVRIHYSARTTEESTWREVNPYALVHVSTTWYLVGYCHLRKALRNFRLDRMNELMVLPKRFSRPANFKIRQTEGLISERQIIVKVLADESIIRWINETHFFYLENSEPHPYGMLLTFRVRNEQDLLGWLLSWGSSVIVLEPESLRQKLIEEAHQILRNHIDLLP